MGALHKFHSRAPRYVLRPTDRNVMRFSLQNTSGTAGIEETNLVNLSESGLAFITGVGSRLEVGERIKVEIPIPGGDQIAWWARVVRVQEHRPRYWFSEKDPFEEASRLFVALKFEELPEPHTRAIRKGIEKSFLQAIRDQRNRRLMYYRVFFTQNLFKILAYVALTVLAIGLLYWISLPTENYTRERGAPWGERIKF